MLEACVWVWVGPACLWTGAKVGARVGWNVSREKPAILHDQSAPGDGCWDHTQSRRLQSLRTWFTLELFGCISFNSCQVINSLAEREKKSKLFRQGREIRGLVWSVTRTASAGNGTRFSSDSRRCHPRAFRCSMWGDEMEEGKMPFISEALLKLSNIVCVRITVKHIKRWMTVLWCGAAQRLSFLSLSFVSFSFFLIVCSLYKVMGFMTILSMFAVQFHHVHFQLPLLVLSLSPVFPSQVPWTTLWEVLY